MPNENEITWKVTGRKLGDTTMDPKPSIDITEGEQGVRMPDGSAGPYGIPVDAPLGVTLIKALWERVEGADADTLRKMLQGSFAITLDKNVLLKTISQPRCEGVRFYLCLKQSDNKEDLLSLVTVGVDEAGKDLLYEYKDGVPVAEVPTRSLVAEYGHPPYLMSQANSAALDPFVLFKYSQ